jgi:hypothetical protein
MPYTNTEYPTILTHHAGTEVHEQANEYSSKDRDESYEMLSSSESLSLGCTSSFMKR